MDFYVSYFYQLRNFPKNAVPLSTAMWDPQWFHNFKGQKHIFVDKRGITNGLKINKLIFPQSVWEKLESEGTQCQKDCPQKKDGSCPFMQEYYKTIEKSYKSIKDLEKDCQLLINSYVKKIDENQNDIIILLVHEAPSSPCSERVVLKKWFHDHGYELKEWEPTV